MPRPLEPVPEPSPGPVPVPSPSGKGSPVAGPSVARSQRATPWVPGPAVSGVV